MVRREGEGRERGNEEGREGEGRGGRRGELGVEIREDREREGERDMIIDRKKLREIHVLHLYSCSYFYSCTYMYIACINRQLLIDPSPSRPAHRPVET